MSFEVATYADLKKVGTGVDGWNMDSDYIQTADIDASASATENPDGAGGYYGFVPIGASGANFTGSYNGQEYTISNLYINRPATYYVGLFGYVSSSTKSLSNIILEDTDITGRDYVGGICGYCNEDVSYCSVSGSIVGEDHVGGLIGYLNYGKTISYSYTTCSADGITNVGGLVGYNYEGSISVSFSTGAVSGTDKVGGFIGYNNSSLTVTNCYALGSVDGNDYIGGFIGWSYDGTITNCYSAGAVTGSTNVGGFCGVQSWSASVGCYWDTTTSGQATSDGGTGLTTADMTYPYDNDAYDGWDFINIWINDADTSINDGYPILAAFYDKYVLTYSATNITYEGAKLKGKAVTDGSADVKAYFEYRIKGDASWTGSSKLDIETTQPFETTITGLDGLKVYEFRAVLEESSTPISYGLIREFTTLSEVAADKIQSIATPISLKTTKEINGAWTSQMQILPDDYAATDSYIDIDSEHYVVKKLRRIKSRGKYYFDVDLLHNAIEELSVQTVDRMNVLDDATTIMTAIIDGSGWTVGTVDITDIVSFILDRRVSKLEALTLLATKCNAELDYNSKDRTVDLKYQIGTVTGLQLRYDKNCTEIIKEEDSSDLVTRIYPYGSDNYPINCTVLDDCEDESLYSASSTGSTLASDEKMYKSIGIELASETLNETFIRDLGAGNVVDLSGHDLLKFWIYSEADNANGFTFGIGGSAYTDITVNTGALTAKCWREITLDLSATADANKNAIRYIGFKNLSSGSVTAVFDFIRAFNGEEYIDSPNISLYKVPKELVYQHSAKLERSQVTIQIYPSADAEVKQSAPNSNFGNSTYLESRDEPVAAYDYMSYMKFALTQIPTDATITSANLKLYVYWLGVNGSNTGVTSNVHLAAANWDESTLTWNNKPAVGALINTMSMTSIGWKTLDITDEFNDWRDGVTDNNGIRLFPSSANANRNAAWYSKEALQNKPYIEVTYTILNDPKDIIKAAAQDYLYANDEPKLKYSVKAADLSKVIVDTWEDEEIALGDTVKIYDAELDLNVAVRIKKITRDILDPTDIDLELVNKAYTFADEQAKIAKQLSYAMPFKDNPNIVSANAVQVGYTGSDTNA